MVIVRIFAWVYPRASVTLNSAVTVAAVVGVPEILPVALDLHYGRQVRHLDPQGGLMSDTAEGRVVSVNLSEKKTVP